jgi:hypothetical protein
MLKWDPFDLLNCLKVEPHTDKDGVEHSYSVAHNGLRLLITVFQYDGDVYFSLYRDGESSTSILDLKICQCPAIQYGETKHDEWLDFLPGRLPDAPHDKAAAIARGVRVKIYPDIRLEFLK